jgi:hypothetical protein
MSKVFSFRLSEDNPREIQAMEVMEVWISQGYPLRYILTEALIRLGNNSDSPEEIEKLLDRLVALFEGLENGNIHINTKSVDTNSALPSTFIESIMKSAKQGLNTG